MSVKGILKAPTDYKNKNVDSQAKLSITEQKKAVTFDASKLRPSKKTDASKHANGHLLQLSMLTLRFSDVEAKIKFTDYLRKEVYQQS